MDIEATNVLSRRSLVKLAFVAACALPAQVALAGCSSSTGTPGTATGQGSEKGDGSAGTSVGKDPASANGSAQAPTTADADGGKDKMPRVLVAYFSGTGHTERVAQLAAEQLGAGTFVITPIDPYTSDDLNYNNESSRVCREHDDPNRSVELEVVTPEDFAGYDTVLVGYPIWWYELPMPLYTFFENYDLSGKRVAPFVVHGGSGLSGTVQDIEALQPDADVEEDGLSINRRDVQANAEASVGAWVESLGLSERNPS